LRRTSWGVGGRKRGHEERGEGEYRAQLGVNDLGRLGCVWGGPDRSMGVLGRSAEWVPEEERANPPQPCVTRSAGSRFGLEPGESSFERGSLLDTASARASCEPEKRAPPLFEHVLCWHRNLLRPARALPSRRPQSPRGASH
jgi:hypothetical protein